jgi:hypothetical protein
VIGYWNSVEQGSLLGLELFYGRVGSVGCTLPLGNDLPPGQRSFVKVVEHVDCHFPVDTGYHQSRSVEYESDLPSVMDTP